MSKKDNDDNKVTHVGFSVTPSSGDKEHWNPVGTAKPTKEGGFVTNHHSVPLNGKTVWRPIDELKKIREDNDGAQNQEINHDQSL